MKKNKLTILPYEENKFNLYLDYKVRIQLIREKNINYLELKQINNSSDAYSLVKDRMQMMDREMMLVLLLNTNNRVHGIHEVSVGTINMCYSAPRDLYKAALISNSTQIIISHNHPSGCSSPSQADHITTENINKAGEILGIKLLDHLIIGDNSYYSFADNHKISISN